MKKLLLAILCASALTCSASASSIPNFSDIQPSDWYNNAVTYVCKNGLMNGTSSTTFSPNDTTSRGMIVTILYRLAGSPDMPESNWGYPYADVDANAYYSTPVYWARMNSLVNGYSDTQFGPNDAITREQMAAILYRYAQYKGMEAVTLQESLGGFTDAGEISAYAVSALNWAVYEGVLNGRGDGILMLILYIALMWYTIRAAGRTEEAPAEGAKAPMAAWLAAVMIVGGLAGLVFGGELFLDSATALARQLGVSESVIAITLVAGGTSLPELASSVVSLVKGKADMALGNVIGSNIANILLILGLSATINPLTMGGITTTDLAVVILTSLLLFLTAFTFRRRAVDRWEGVIFLVIYALYIWQLVR